MIQFLKKLLGWAIVIWLLIKAPSFVAWALHTAYDLFNEVASGLISIAHSFGAG
jgi:hypothetical protein